VLGADGQALAALTSPYITPINRPKAPDIPQTIRMLADTASRLSAMIGGHGAGDETGLESSS
jgi:hypothetical protein